MIAKDTLQLRSRLGKKGADTYQKIYEQMGVSRATCAKIFVSKTPVRFTTFQRIADFLGDDVEVADIARMAEEQE